MAILVTGGSGYISSVTVEMLRAQREQVVITRRFIPRPCSDRTRRRAILHQGKVGDRTLVRHILATHYIDAFIHFAALTYLGESVNEPLHYYENNANQSLALLQELVTGGVRQIVFSSTAATYGEPQYTPLDEAHPQHPENPYGWGKLLGPRAVGFRKRLWPALCRPALF